MIRNSKKLENKNKDAEMYTYNNKQTRWLERKKLALWRKKRFVYK